MKKIDPKTVSAKSEELAGRAADSVKDAIDATRGAANRTLDAAEESVENLREGISEKAGHAADEVRRYVRAGRDYASDACGAVKGRLADAGECTASYVREKPAQAVFIAALGGVLLACLINALTRSRHPDA